MEELKQFKRKLDELESQVEQYMTGGQESPKLPSPYSDTDTATPVAQVLEPKIEILEAQHQSQASLEELKQDVNRLATQYQQVNGMLGKHAGALGQLEKDLGRLQIDDMGRAVVEADELTKRMSQLEDALGDLYPGNSPAADDATIGEMQTRLTSVEETLGDIQQNSAEEGQLSTRLLERVLKLEEAKNGLRIRVLEVEKRCSSIERRLADQLASGSAGAIKDDIDVLRSGLANAMTKQDASVIEEDLEELKAEVSELGGKRIAVIEDQYIPAIKQVMERVNTQSEMLAALQRVQADLLDRDCGTDVKPRQSTRLVPVGSREEREDSDSTNDAQHDDAGHELSKLCAEFKIGVSANRVT